MGDESEMLGTVGGFRGLVTLVGEERVGEGEGARRKERKRGERMGREGEERNRGGRIKIPCLNFFYLDGRQNRC